MKRIRLDLASIFEYAALLVLFWLMLQSALFQIPPLEAAPEEPSGLFSPALFSPAFVSVLDGSPEPTVAPDMIISKDWDSFAQRDGAFTREDLDFVVRTVACESPYEPLSGVRAVVHVIKTRAIIRELSYEQVVMDPWQFSCWNSYILPSLKLLRDKPRETLGVGKYNDLKWTAMGVMSGDLSNPFPGADLYYSHCSIDPPFWAYKAEYLGSIGCHSFYKSGKD